MAREVSWVRNARAAGRVALGGVRPTGEDHRVTTFELFFDLVYVFAMTQVTGYMAHEHSGHGVVRGLLLLALLWWTWSAYAWLGNQARADEGLVRAGMAVAMAAIFVVALTVPEAWQDAPGGLDGPLVLVGAYLVVRCAHLILYAVAAAGDRELRRQLTITWGPLLASAALLVAGALLGGWAQTWLFAGALLVDWVGVWLTSRQGSWRLHSAGHWTERHGNFIILAIGESVVAIGVGAAQQPISTPLLVGAILGVAVAVGLWWLYFDVASLAPSTDSPRRAARSGSGWPWRPTPSGTSPSSPASCSPPWASRACWPTPRTPSRWAASTRRRCSAGWRCTWPGSCCSSGACTAARAFPGWWRSACSWRRCQQRSLSRR
jgi:low temperature requirement protein LtrA